MKIKLNRIAKDTNLYLKKFLNKQNNSKLIPAMKYGLFPGGKKIRSKIDQRIKKVLDHGQYILGPEVNELEQKLGVFANSKYVLCCSSGTDALLLALLGLKLRPGEGVIVPAFTFASSAEVIPLLGAIPIFIDVEKDTFNLDPKKLGDAMYTANKKGIIVKGIMSVEDAKRAVDIGCTGIMVSNHGGRQLDGSRAPFDQLAEICDAVGDKIDVVCEGGIQRGTHVLKALSVGAKCCSIGRYYLYALAAAGQAGVERALNQLAVEVERDMKLMGVTRVEQLSRSNIRIR